ncbi:MAG: 50S ribosomal protein L22 [Nanoarchaeota archaeon]
MYKYCLHPLEMIVEAKGRNLPISRKHSVEVARFIRGKKLKDVLRILDEIQELKTPIKLTKHNRGVAHKSKVGPGRYPVKVAQHIKKVILSAKANAEYKGIKNIDEAIVVVEANKGQTLPHGGRKIGTRRKATHIFVKLIIKENEKEEKGDVQ